MNTEPTPQDLADKFKQTDAERAQGFAAIKGTERNAICPCGCGKKAKKCQNGRTVLQYKKLLRGSVVSELLAAMVLFGLAFAAITAVRDSNPQHPTLSFFSASPDSVQSKP